MVGVTRLSRRWSRCRRAVSDDDGRAIIEVVFLAVLVLIPTMYILVAILRLQSATLAVTQAARDVGRLMETSSPAPSSSELTELASLALTDQHVATDSLRIRQVPVGADCDDPDDAPPNSADRADYDICVTAVISLPGVPTVLTGSANTVTGVYTVHQPGPPH